MFVSGWIRRFFCLHCLSEFDCENFHRYGGGKSSEFAVTLVELNLLFLARIDYVRIVAICLFRGFLTGDTSAHGTDKFDASNHDVSSQMEGLLIGPWQLSEAKYCPGLLLPHYH